MLHDPPLKKTKQNETTEKKIETNKNKTKKQNKKEQNKTKQNKTWLFISGSLKSVQKDKKSF